MQSSKQRLKRIIRIMATDDKREAVIQNITEMLRRNGFTFEFEVKKRPQGIKVIYEVTQEELNAMMAAAEKQHRKEKKEG